MRSFPRCARQVRRTREKVSTRRSGDGYAGKMGSGEVGRWKRRRDPDRWLIAIGSLKLLKGTLFVSLGFGVLKMVHRDVAEVLLRVAWALRLDPENRLANLLLERTEYLTPHRIRLIGFGIFFYALLDFIEGGGLVLGRPWAEYLTIVLTASFLPYEVFEMLRHASWLKAGVTVLNATVLVYLVVHQKARLRKRNREVVAARE
jgi:uncharacterized membrane protein (DUF2068 family)